MRRIHPPQCTICNQRAAHYESDVWLTLKMCVPCHQAVVEFICRSSYDHGNPMLIELAAGLDSAERPDSFRVWRQRNDSTAWYEYWIKYDSDSKNNFEEPLDMLDQVCLDSTSSDVISSLPVIPGLLTGLD